MKLDADERVTGYFTDEIVKGDRLIKVRLKDGFTHERRRVIFAVNNADLEKQLTEIEAIDYFSK